jgi:hypothetical protein
MPVPNKCRPYLYYEFVMKMYYHAVKYKKCKYPWEARLEFYTFATITESIPLINELLVPKDIPSKESELIYLYLCLNLPLLNNIIYQLECLHILSIPYVIQFKKHWYIKPTWPTRLIKQVENSFCVGFLYI